MNHGYHAPLDEELLPPSHKIVLPEGALALPGRVTLWPYQRDIADVR